MKKNAVDVPAPLLLDVVTQLGEVHCATDENVRVVAVVVGEIEDVVTVRER